MEKTIITLGKFFFKYRNALFPLVYLGLLVLTRPALFLGNARLDRYVCALGVLLTVAGQALRVLVIGFAYIIRGGRDGKVYAESLVQSGFYAHSRNPMYVGNYLMMVGFVLLYGSLWGYVLVLPFFTLVYYAIVKTEEGFLREKFGREYDEYSARVNRFIPSVRGLQQSLQSYRYDWRKVLQKEYGTITLLLCGILLVLVWKEIALFGPERVRREIWVLALMLIPILVFYGTVRYLKKSGRLERARLANQHAVNP